MNSAPIIFLLLSGSLTPARRSRTRGNEKYPPKDHMRTFLTAVLVLERSPGPELIRKVRRYRFDKSYLFSLRGFSQGRIIVVDLPSKKVYTSPAAKDVAAFFRQAL